LISKKSSLLKPLSDEISNRYRGHSIDASYQVSVQLAKQFQGRRFLEIDQFVILSLLLRELKKGETFASLLNIHDGDIRLENSCHSDSV
jgi:hypothetical protein